ncbi:MAG: polysaccharide biosynthesis tyrosine autokinase [Sphingobium sp.]
MNASTAIRVGEQERQAPRLNLRRIFNAVLRRWLLITIIFIINLVAAFLAYSWTPQLFSSTARVTVDRRSDDLVAPDKSVPALTADSAVVDTEVQKLQSPELLASAVDKLHLDQDTEFNGSISGKAARDQAIATLGGKLNIHRDGTSFSIAVSGSSRSPVMAANMVNTLIDVYTAGQVASKSQERDRQIKLLNEKLQQLRTQMMTAEAATADYRIRNGIIDATKDSTVRQEEISALNTELASAKAAQAAATSHLSASRQQSSRGHGAEALDSTLSSPVIADLRRQQAQLSVHRAELLQRYGPLHPELQQVDQQLSEINSRIGSETSRIAASLETQAMVANGRTSSLQSSINQVEGTVMRQTAASVGLDQLQRNADSAKGTYLAFLDQYRSVSAQLGTDKSGINIIARGQIAHQPDWPSPAVFLLGGLMGAVILSGLAITILQLFQSGLENGDDVFRALGISVVGSVPDLVSIPKSGISARNPIAPSTYLLQNPGSAFSESIRSLRTVLQMQPGANSTIVVAVTSALPGEGKTTLAMSLARSAAIAGQKVLLIDTDMRRRTSSKSMADTVQRGLAEVLGGSAKFHEVVVKDSASGAFLLPQTAADVDKYDAISPASVENMIAQVRGHYDLVILDSAPVLAVAEARVVAAAADLVLLAMRWRTTPAQATDSALAHLQRADANVAGVVLTLVNIKEQQRSGSGDEAFYKSYASYYQQ